MFNKLRSLRRGHPFVFCVSALLVCWFISLFAAGILFDLAFGDLIPDERMAGGVGTVFCDGVLAAVALLILRATGRASLVAKRGSGFLKGLAVAAVPLAFSCIVVAVMVVGVLSGSAEGELREMGYNVAFDMASVVIIVSFLFVGLGEELACRGIVAQTMLEHFGTERAGVWKAAVVSGLFFCLLHSGNFLVGAPLFVAMQMVGAFGAGILYGAIYYRTGNIWVLVLVHGLNDIMAGMAVWLGSSTVTDAMGSANDLNPFPLVMFAIYVLLTCFLLRPKKIGQVKQNWPELEGWRAEEAGSKAAA